LLQRGAEGVISITRTLPRSFALPVVLVDLPDSEFPELITDLKCQQLAAMGEAAAQSMLGHIEDKTGYLTRIALAPNALLEFSQPETIVTVPSPGATVEHFAD
jgi:hypothetical protein